MYKARHKILRDQCLLVKKVWGMEQCLLPDRNGELEDLTVLLSPLLAHWTFPSLQVCIMQAAQGKCGQINFKTHQRGLS